MCDFCVFRHLFLKFCLYTFQFFFSPSTWYSAHAQTAAVLLQSLAIIHTSDPQTHCQLSHNAPQLQNFPRHIWPSLCCLTSPSLFSSFSFMCSPSGSASSGFICWPSFFFKLSKFHHLLLSIQPLVFHNLPQSLFDINWKPRNKAVLVIIILVSKCSCTCFFFKCLDLRH